MEGDPEPVAVHVRGARRLCAALASALLLLGALAPLPRRRAERTLHRTGTDDPATVDPHRSTFPGEQLVVLDMFMGSPPTTARGWPVAGCAES